MSVLKLPTLEGKADREVVVAIELLRRAIEHGQASAAGVSREIVRTQQAIPSMSSISAALSSGGSAPVVVTNSLGGLPASPDDRRLFLSGTVIPSWQRVRDQDLALADLTVNDATEVRHGFLPRLPGDPTLVLNGLGEWVSGSGSGGGGLGAGFWAPVTNGDPLSPEILFDSRGEVIMAFEVHPGP